MNIILNGSPKYFAEAVHVEDVVRSLCKNPAHIIAELNGSIVPKTARGTTPIKEGDQLELVSFVGGG